MITIRAIVAGLLLLLMSGCRWSEPLLPAPNAEIDRRLIGDWKAVGENGGSLSISSIGDHHYSVIVEAISGSTQTQFSFRGYHTDIGDVRLLSLELMEARYGTEIKKLPDGGRQQRWIPIGYALTDDGLLTPRMISQYVTPRTKSNEEMLALTGKQLYESFAGALASPHHRERFFDTDTQIPSFRKEKK